MRLLWWKHFYDFLNGIKKWRVLECVEGCDPSSKMMVVSWWDTDIGKIKKMLSEKVPNKDNLCEIIRNKHRKKIAGREVGCDLTDSFKSIKNGAKMLTMKKDPSDLNSSQVSNAIENDSRVNLKIQWRAIVLFLRMQPWNYDFSKTQRLILKAFMANGMIGEAHKTCQSVVFMMKTLLKWLIEKNRNYEWFLNSQKIGWWGSI